MSQIQCRKSGRPEVRFYIHPPQTRTTNFQINLFLKLRWKSSFLLSEWKRVDLVFISCAFYSLSFCQVILYPAVLNNCLQQFHLQPTNVRNTTRHVLSNVVLALSQTQGRLLCCTHVKEVHGPLRENTVLVSIWIEIYCNFSPKWFLTRLLFCE